MRHGKKVNHLSRKSQHRKLMLGNMACSLIMHKRIKTTVAKAKALKRFVEPLVTRSKENSTHNRRMCFKYLQQKEAVAELFSDVAAKVGDRPGGYTRIIRIGNRYGDNAEMCIFELVDYNEIYTTEKKATTGKKKRRRRRGSGAGKAATAATPIAATTETAEAVVENVEETVTETVVEEAAETTEQVTAETVEEVAEETVVEEEATTDAGVEEVNKEESQPEEENKEE